MKTFLIVLGVIVGLAIIGTWASDVDESATTDFVATEENSVSLEDFMYQEFMSTCVPGGGYQYCDCTFNYMVNKWGVEVITRGGQTYLDSGRVINEFMEAGEACLYPPQVN